MAQKERRLVTFDWAMKSILRNKANFDILEGFLTSLLEEDIKIESILESESNKDSIDERNNRVNLRCRDSQGRDIIIEIQSQHEFNYLQRVLFGTSKAVVESLSSGEDYEKVAKVISISILYHPLDCSENTDYIYHGRTEMIGLHKKDRLLVRRAAQAIPEYGGDVMPEYYFLCVGNYKERYGKKIDDWMHFFKTQAIPDDATAPGLKEAKKRLDYLALSAEDRARFDRYQDGLRYQVNIVDSALTRGRAAGLEEGRAEGRAEGIELGRAEGIELGRVEGEARGSIQGAVGMCRDFGASRDETVARVARIFNLSEADARVEIDRYWAQE